MDGSSSKEIPKACAKMCLLDHDYFECKDTFLQVVRDIIHNFNSMADVINIAISTFDTDNSFLEITCEVELLIKFIWWALKWCVGIRGTISRRFFDILIKVEAFFIKASHLFSVVAQPSDLSQLCTNFCDMFPDFYSMRLSILNADLNFWKNVFPEISMTTEESMMKDLEELLEDEVVCEMHRKQCVFLKMFIQFIKEHTDQVNWWDIHRWVECALDMMSCYYHGCQFSNAANRIDEIIHIVILHVLTYSSPPFTWELMAAYVECFQMFLIWLPRKSNYQVKFVQELLSLVHSLVTEMQKHEINPEIGVDDALRKLGRAVPLFLSSEFDGVKGSSELSDWFTSIFPVLFLPLLDHNGFMSDEILIKYAYYFRHYQFQLPTDDADIGLKNTPRDQSKSEDDLVFYARLVFYQWSENHVVQEVLFKGREMMIGVLIKLGFIIFSSLNNEVKGNIAKKLNPGLEYVNVHFTRAISFETFKRLNIQNPETDLLGFLKFFLENLEELRICNLDLRSNWKDQLQTIQEALVLFRSFIQNVRNKGLNDDESRDLSICIRNAAYDAEYVISAFAAGAFHFSCRSFIISNLITRFNQIGEKANTKEITIEGSSDVLPHKQVSTTNVNKHAVSMSSRVSATHTDVVVGFEAEKKQMMECCASNLKQLDVISIVGMSGIGKTTFAKVMYEDPFTVNHFHLRSWCCVSQHYEKKEVLLTILGIDDATGQKKSCEELSLMLHKMLKGRKYLIVLDDVWDIDVFNEIKRLFPKDNNGSRIVLTSRTISIGLQAKVHSDPIILHPLSIDESWKLLKQKVFPVEEFPVELFQIGKEITRKCGGLPLAIVVVAGVLAKSYKELDVWEEVAERLNIYNAGDSQGERGMKALDLSYEFLPDHLKPLFLYVAAFPENDNIHAENLKWLWIAEGFIRENKKRSLEDEAETCLMDLIDRSLLMVAKRKSDGSVKTCCIHDLMRDMSLTKCGAENFMQHHTQEMEHVLEQSLIYPRRVSVSLIRSTCENTPNHSTIDEAPPRPPVTYEDLSRLSMASRLNSLLLFNHSQFCEHDELCKSIFQNHKILRVLYTSEVWVTDFPLNNVTLPVHLRYISLVCSSLSKLPSSLCNLWNLETLIITTSALDKDALEVPIEVWKMTKLRHLHIGAQATFSDIPEDSCKLENLQTLSTPTFRGEQANLIGRFPSLKKLKCIFLYGETNISELPRLESLCKLEALKVSWHGDVACSTIFSLPSTLKKLTLSLFRLQWKDIARFQELPNLEILKLQDNVVEDELWDMGDAEFRKLKFLKLKNLDIKQWVATDENFPCLQNLVLQSCEHLEEIPSGVGYTCDKIEVIYCSHSTSESAKRIQEEQEEMGNRLLNVYISDSKPLLHGKWHVNLGGPRGIQKLGPIFVEIKGFIS